VRKLKRILTTLGLAGILTTTSSTVHSQPIDADPWYKQGDPKTKNQFFNKMAVLYQQKKFEKFREEYEKNPKEVEKIDSTGLGWHLNGMYTKSGVALKIPSIDNLINNGKYFDGMGKLGALLTINIGFHGMMSLDRIGNDEWWNRKVNWKYKLNLIYSEDLIMYSIIEDLRTIYIAVISYVEGERYFKDKKYEEAKTKIERTLELLRDNKNPKYQRLINDAKALLLKIAEKTKKK